MGVEQPVAVCPECGGTKDDPRPIPSEQLGILVVCKQPFHASTEQGSHYDKCKVCGDERQFIDGKWHHLKGDGPCVEPTARAIAGELRICVKHNSPSCYACMLESYDDMRRLYTERDEQVADLLRPHLEPTPAPDEPCNHEQGRTITCRKGTRGCSIHLVAEPQPKGEPQPYFAQTVAGEPPETKEEVERLLNEEINRVRNYYKTKLAETEEALAGGKKIIKQLIVDKQNAEKQLAKVKHERDTTDNVCKLQAERIAELKQKLVERDAVIEKVREIAVKAYYGKMGSDMAVEYEEALAGLEKIDDMTAPSSLASPSTILESVRQEERERCAKIAKDQIFYCRSRSSAADDAHARSAWAASAETAQIIFNGIAAIRQNPEAEKEKKA